MDIPLEFDLAPPEGLPRELACGLEDTTVFRDPMPGAPLVEEEIASRFAISRSPVRETIRHAADAKATGSATRRMIGNSWTTRVVDEDDAAEPTA